MKNRTIKRKKGMMYQFVTIFSVATLLMLIFSFVCIYQIQMNIGNENSVRIMNAINRMLKDEITDDGENFMAYMDYMEKNLDRIYISPMHDWKKDRQAFSIAFKETYPGRTYGEDIAFDEMDTELKDLYVIWYQEYWMDRFNYYETVYGSPSVYFVRPEDDGHHVVYMIDFEVLIDENAKDGRMLLWDNYDEDPEEMKIMFKTWNAGTEIPEYDVFDNEYGVTYSKYLPVYIDGRKAGMVCSDTNLALLRRRAFHIAALLTAIESIVWLMGMAFLMLYIRINYIKRIEGIILRLEEYGRERNEDSIQAFRTVISKKHDELDTITTQIIYLLEQLDSQVKKIVAITAELDGTKTSIGHLKGLAESDTLSGLGNKYAYRKKEEQLNKSIEAGTARFSVAMFDLNYLKKINDTYGHDKGDIAIKKLAEYIEKFFGKYNAYRIGGDEFVIILDGVGSSESIINKFNALDEAIEKDAGITLWDKVSFAKGFSVYLPGLDTCVEDVFKRADESMYRNKQHMKANRS